MIYILNYIGVFFWFGLAKLMQIKEKKVPLILCFFQFTLLIGLRSGIGADYKAYENMFYIIKSNSKVLDISIVEPGFGSVK